MPADPDKFSTCELVTGHARVPAAPAYAVRVRVTFTYNGGATDVRFTDASTAAPYLYTVPTPAAVRASIYPVNVAAIAYMPDGVTTFALTNSPITIGPCLTAEPDCDSYTVTQPLDPNTPYNITAAVSYGSAQQVAAVQSNGGRFYIRVVRLADNVTIYNNANVPMVVSGLTLRAAVNNLPGTGQTGRFMIQWGITGPFGAINCGGNGSTSNNGIPEPPAIFPVTNKPYFQVNGGDVSAGAGMGTGAAGVDCAMNDNPKAGIVSWNRGAAGAYGGAGTQYAALALNYLQGFATGKGSGLVPSGVSFGNTGGTANQVDLAQGLYGGEFGSAACTADYFANAGTPLPGPQTIGATVLAKGERRTIYVDGNVYITGNITFGPAGVGYTYANTSEIPSFSLVVKGNIYIAPGVTQLDGFYIAQPSNGTATNGIIYTCAPSGFGTNALNVLTSTLQANCNTALTVNGAFVARQIWLLRTAGTVTTTAAETFNYVPELWLSAPFGNGLSPVSGDDYDAITSLPPVL